MASYYDDSDMADDAASPSEAEGDESTNDKKYKDDNQVTALLPKSILAGKHFEVGEEVVLEIVHEYEDEIEVKYASSTKKEKDESSDSDSEEMSSAMERMDKSMA